MVFPVCASCFLHTDRPSYHAKACAIHAPRGFLKKQNERNEMYENDSAVGSGF